MYNYVDHEAACPTDKASYKVLYNDYFHDSLITSISMQPEKHSVEMHIQCSRECEEETGDWRKDIYNRKYSYVLTFSGVTYLDIKTEMSGAEYLNGRFKAIAKGKYYFRIQTVDGYIDIGYRNFKLRKPDGRVSYRGITEFDRWMDRTSATEDEICHIINRLQNDGYGEEEDFDLYLDLERLYDSKTSRIADYLRKYAVKEWEMDAALPYAGWLLGKYGSADDIPIIQQLLNRTDNSLIRQNLLDAIDALTVSKKTV